MITPITLEHPEIDNLLAHLPKMAERFSKALQFKGMTPRPLHEIEDVIKQHVAGEGDQFLLCTAGPCAVAYNVVQLWWSADFMLVEEFVIRYKAGNFADTIKALEQHAKTVGCKSLVVSGLAMLRAESYGDYLQRKGFREVTREYVKGIEHG